MTGMLFKSLPVGFRRLIGKKNVLYSGGFLIFRKVFAGKKAVFHSRGMKALHYLYGGNGYIAGEAEGIVTVDGQPASRRIYLFALPRMECIADTWSNPDGSYRFDRLNTEKEYMMVARDYKKQYEPVSYDFIKPYVDSDG